MLLVAVFHVAGGVTHPSRTVVWLCFLPALLLDIRRQSGEVDDGSAQAVIPAGSCLRKVSPNVPLPQVCAEFLRCVCM